MPFCWGEDGGVDWKEVDEISELEYVSTELLVSSDVVASLKIKTLFFYCWYCLYTDINEREGSFQCLFAL